MSINQKGLQCVNAILTTTWSQKGFTPEVVLWSVTNGYDLQGGIQSNSFSPVTFVIIPDVLVKHLITKLCLSSLYAMAYQTMLAGMMVSITGTEIPHGFSRYVFQNSSMVLVPYFFSGQFRIGQTNSLINV